MSASFARRRAWQGALLLAVAPRALAAAVPAAQAVDRVRGEAAVAEAVAARLALEHASSDGFAHETLVTALAGRIAAALAGEQTLAAWLADEVTFVWTQEAPTQFARTGAVDAERYEPLSSPALLRAADVAFGLDSMLQSLPGVPPWKVKVLRAERTSPARLAMRVKLARQPEVRAAGTAPADRSSGRLVLELSWSRLASPAGSEAAPDDGTAWLVDEVTVVALERATARRGFDDVTATVLAPSAGSRAQLAPSIPALRLGLDAALGVGFLGHHGVAVGDANGDGLDDVYLCQPGGLPDQLWLRRADGTAVDAASALGLDLLDATSSALFVDLDNDGDQDLVRATGDALLVHVNRGGAFTEAAAFAVGGGTSLAAADVDRDGRVDLFLCTYGSPYTGGGLPVPYHDARNGTPNLLLANRSGAQDALAFVDVTEDAGMGGPDQRFSFAASFEDYDDDGDQDLYVANDFGRNNLWRNDTAGGEVRFVDVAAAAGVEDLAAGMGVTWADFDVDGRADLYVSNMFSSAGNRVGFDPRFRAGASDDERAAYHRHASGNSLFYGLGDGTFELSSAAYLGLWAWGGLAFELDGDGRPDLYVPNGFVTGANPDDL